MTLKGAGNVPAYIHQSADVPKAVKDVIDGKTFDYGTVVTVYGDRIPLAERQILDAGAPISVVTREEIDASGAQSLQEVLAELPGVTLHNQTGNPRESTVDVRGFPQGNSTAVFLDGVRLNDLQDNSVRWDVIPLEDVERIEVYRGASGPLYGGGALAGVRRPASRKPSSNA